MRNILLVVVGCLAGCSATPYLDVGVGYRIDENSSWYLRTERSWTCDSNLTAHFEVGLELDHQVSVGYHHQSYWSCGRPFNDSWELTEDEITVTKRFGGK